MNIKLNVAKSMTYNRYLFQCYEAKIKRAEDLLINGRGKSSVSGQWDKEEIIQ